MATQQRFFQNLITGQVTQTTDWQLALKPGDHYIIENPKAYVGTRSIPMPNVYGEIIEVADNGYCKVKAFSAFCPDGELGSMCIVDPTRLITSYEFKSYQIAGWPVGG